jgi:hypothetical protein
MSVSHTALSHNFPVFISASLSLCLSLFLSLSAAPRVYSYEDNQAAAAAAAGAPSLNCTFSTGCRNSLKSLLVALTTNYHLPCHDLQRSFQSLSLSPSLANLSVSRGSTAGVIGRVAAGGRKEAEEPSSFLLCPGKEGFPVQEKGLSRALGPIQGAKAGH